MTTLTSIPVEILVDGKRCCRADMRILVDERDRIHHELHLPSDDLLVGVEANRVEARAVNVCDAVAYFGALYPDSIGRDQ